MSDKEKRCVNHMCRRLLVDEKDFVCSRCKRLGWKYTKDFGQAAGIVVGSAVAIVTGLNKGKSSKG